jgi:hypothetical protein
MHMIGADCQLVYRDIVLLRNIDHSSLTRRWILPLEQISTVFVRPDYMVLGIVDSIGCVSGYHVAMVHLNRSW